MKIAELFENVNTKVLFIGFSKYKKFLKNITNYTFVGWKDIDEAVGSANGIDITSYDFIFFGAVIKSRNKAHAVYKIAVQHNIPYLLYGTLEEDNKSFQHQMFLKHNINHPHSFSSTKENTSSVELLSKFQFPFIAKPDEGSKGEGVVKIANKNQLTKFLKEPDNYTYVFQEYLENDGDYRVFFFKNKLLFSIKRTSQSSKEFRNNLSLGGKQEYVTLPTEVQTFAKKIDKHFKQDFSGIDLINHNGNWYIIEINGSPQFQDKEQLVIPAIEQYIKNL